MVVNDIRSEQVLPSEVSTCCGFTLRLAVSEPECDHAVKRVIDQPVKAHDRQFTDQLLDHTCLVSTVVGQPVEPVDSFSLSRSHSGSETVTLGFNLHVQ